MENSRKKTQCINQIDIIQPDLIVFLTGTNGRYKKAMETALNIKLQKQICNSDSFLEITEKAIWAYHPNYRKVWTNDFIKNFANQFDDTELEEFSPETEFRELDEWSSLVGLAILNMIEKKYKVSLNFGEMRSSSTIRDLFDLVESKIR